jgi:hypothetical protein
MRAFLTAASAMFPRLGKGHQMKSLLSKAIPSYMRSASMDKAAMMQTHRLACSGGLISCNATSGLEC